LTGCLRSADYWESEQSRFTETSEYLDEVRLLISLASFA